MLNNIRISRYIKRNTIVHNTNTLSKLISLILFLVLALIISNIYIHFLFLVILIVIMIISKISLKTYFSSIKYIYYLMIGIFLINFMTNIDIMYSFLSIIRIIEIVIYTSIITITSSEAELIFGMNKLLKPLNVVGVKTNQLSFVLTLAIRFIPSIIDQVNTINKSLSSRGVDFYNLKLKNRMLVLKSIIIPTFNLSLKKADDLAEVMEIRLFDINKERTNYQYNEWKIKDTFINILLLLIILIIVKGG